jgi:DNA-binding NtrC family response regulator
MLLLQKYNVLVTRQSSDAVGLAGEHDGPIDLLLTDVVMPRVSGQELAKQIAAIRPGIKVVFMSGYPSGNPTKQGMFHSSSFSLQKPFQMDTLEQVLRQVLGFASRSKA